VLLGSDESAGSEAGEDVGKVDFDLRGKEEREREVEGGREEGKWRQ